MITKEKIDFQEIRRKTLHIIGGLIIATAIYLELMNVYISLIILILGIISSITYRKFNLPVFHFFLERFEREHLKKTFPGKGLIYLFIAITLLLATFEKNITLAAIMIWTFGDSASALVGKHYGSIKHPFNDERVLEGTIAGIICGTLAASFFINWIFVLIAATIAMIIESIDWKLYRDAIDDNFFVPIISAFVIQLLIVIF